MLVNNDDWNFQTFKIDEDESRDECMNGFMFYLNKLNKKPLIYKYIISLFHKSLIPPI